MKPNFVVPPGYKVDKERSTEKEIIITKVDDAFVWESLKNISGYKISENSEILEVKEEKGNRNNKNIFPTFEEAKACLCLSQLLHFRNLFNEDWKPNFKNLREVRYNIIIKANKPQVVENRSTEERVLTFKDEETAKEFLRNFKDLIIIARPLL